MPHPRTRDPVLMRAVIYLNTELPIKLTDFMAQATRLTRELDNPVISDVTVTAEDHRQGLPAEMGLQITGELTPPEEAF